MKNILILIVAIAVFLHFYPQPEVTAFYEENKAKALAAFSSATDTSVRLKVENVYIDMEKEFPSFRKSEQRHIKEVTATRESITSYFNSYCMVSKRDSKLHPDNQTKTCNVIQKYSRYM